MDNDAAVAGFGVAGAADVYGATGGDALVNLVVAGEQPVAGVALAVVQGEAAGVAEVEVAAAACGVGDGVDGDAAADVAVAEGANHVVVGCQVDNDVVAADGGIAADAADGEFPRLGNALVNLVVAGEQVAADFALAVV